MTIDQKAGGGKDERHGILHGQFLRIERQIDSKADGDFLVPRAILRVLGYETSANAVSYFGEQPAAIAQPIAVDGATHMCLDTESQAAPGRGGNRQQAYPVLELAYKTISSDFSEEYTSYRTFLNYPKELRASLGNDASSAVLKFNPDIIVHGEDARNALTALVQQFQRVHASGGAVIGHNVLHDLRQLKATAELVGLNIKPFSLNVFDTVRSANSFVPNAELRWMKLHELARLCQISWDACDPTRGQHRAGGGRGRVAQDTKKGFLSVTHFRAFYEEVQFP